MIGKVTDFGSAKEDDPIHTQGAIIGKMIYQRLSKGLEEKPTPSEASEKKELHVEEKGKEGVKDDTEFRRIF